MYESFFHLTKRPFSATPDATCCYPSDSSRGALQELTSCIEHGQGVGIFTAPAGVGKTLICRKLQLEQSRSFRTVFIPTGNFPSRRAMLQAILFELDQPYGGMGEQELRLELISTIRSYVPDKEGLVLIIDEAHLLSERLLEEIRTLADLSLNGKPLVRVILSGQLSLEETLTSPSLEALNQRISCHINLELLGKAQTADYVAFRLKWAGNSDPGVFTEGALNLIGRACDGVPRCINQLCDHSLLLAFVSDSERVDESLVKEALTDLKQLPLHWNTSVLEEPPETMEEFESDEQFEETEQPARDVSFAPTASFEIGADPQEESTERDDFQHTGEPAENDETVEIDAMAEDIARDWNERYVPEAALPCDTPALSSDCGVDENSIEESHELLNETIAFDPAHATGDAIGKFEVPKSTPKSAEMEEELVVDRYALLDAGRIPEATYNPHRRAEPPVEHTLQAEEPAAEQETLHQPAAHEIPAKREFQVHTDTTRPDVAVDHLLEALDEVLGDSVTISLPPMVKDNTSNPPREVAENQVSETDLENQIGEEVLDLCLETQEFASDMDEINLVDQQPETPDWATEFPGEPESEHETAPESSLPPQSEPPRATRFDVVLPEDHEEPHQEQHQQSPAADASRDTSRPESGPNYKMVFSTLRKRQKKRA